MSKNLFVGFVGWIKFFISQMPKRVLLQMLKTSFGRSIIFILSYCGIPTFSSPILNSYSSFDFPVILDQHSFYMHVVGLL